eukprot:TRINITY_DN3541_c0_g2_i1.p1 TRINITY_DN3541_c0_g2~~TRINITY_DN3541_c0_g2_i1.p1  ORF type:complete len:1862 (-),score=327.36 TRINITY_DN3541_c0_g2_i1:181-5766(-)
MSANVVLGTPPQARRMAVASTAPCRIARRSASPRVAAQGLARGRWVLWLISAASLIVGCDGADGLWKKTFPPWGESGLATSDAPVVRLPLMGPFTRHSCFPSRYMAMRIATSHINRRDSTLCPAIARLRNPFELQYDLWDTHATSVGAASAVLKIVHQMQDQTANASQALAKVVLGPNSSGSSKASSQILTVFGIPQISWAATNADLSNKANYPYYFRTVSPDSFTMEVLAGFVKSLGFNEINVIYFDSDFQAGQARDVRTAAESLLSMKVNMFLVPSSGKGGFKVNEANMVHLKSTLQSVRGNGCRVVVGLAINEEAYDLWDTAHSMGMVRNDGWLWLGADGIAGSQFAGKTERIPPFAGSLYISSMSRGRHFDEFSELWAANMPTTEVPEFTEHALCHTDSGLSVCQGLEEFRGWQPGVHDTSLVCTGYTSAAYDAVITLALAADRLLEGGRDPSTVTQEAWFEEMKKLSQTDVFNCLSGEVAFNENQERKLPMAIYNYQPGWSGQTEPVLEDLEGQLVVSWTSTGGYQWQVGKQVMWPSGVLATVEDMTTPPSLPSGVPPNCELGLFFNFLSDACEPCLPGSRAARINGLSTCVQCAQGSYQDRAGQEQCEPCAPGRFAPDNGLKECLECPEGSHPGAAGQSRCECNAGFTANTDGGCSPCPPGQYSEDINAECRLCPKGRASSSERSTECQACEVAFFQPAAGREQCLSCDTVIKGSHTKLLGAAESKDCECAEGEYWHDVETAGGADGECRSCPDGLLCYGGRSPPVQAAGYAASRPQFNSYASGSAGLNTTLRPIKPPDHIVSCKNLEDCPGGLELGTCPSRREGVACDTCQVGWTVGEPGKCEPCDGTLAMVPLIVAFISAFCFTGVIAFTSTHHAYMPSDTVLTLIVTSGLIAGVTQSLGVFSKVQVEWISPLKQFFQIMRIISVDPNLLRPGCVLNNNNPVLKYVFILSCVPGLIALLVAILLTARLCGKRVKKCEVGSAIGMVTNVFFISISAMVLIPWQCEPNPDGTSSVFIQRSVSCWDNDDHRIMLIISSVAGLVFVLSFFAIICWAALKYPKWITREGGVDKIRYFDFIFKRFKADCYYYGVFLTSRGLLITLVPIIFAKHVEMQILVLAFVIVVYLMISSRICPWHTSLCNLVDNAFGMTLIMLLTVGALLVETESKRGLFHVQVFASVIVGIAALALLSIAVYCIRETLFPRKRYGIFLSHHKGAAQVLARWFKLTLGELIDDGIFLDSDQLDILHTLLHTVAHDTANLVVLLSKETLSRMWCACEVVTGYRAKVNFVLVTMDDYTPPDDAYLDALWSTWDEQQRAELVMLQMEPMDIRMAYEWLNTLPAISLARPVTVREEHRVIKEILASCKQLRRRPLSYLQSSTDGEAESGPAEVLILAEGDDNVEAACTCQVVIFYLQRHLAISVRYAWETGDALEELLGQANYVIALLTRGVLRSPKFASQIVTAVNNTEVEILPLVADCGFGFPAGDYWEQLLAGKVLDPDHPDLQPHKLSDVAVAYRLTLGVIAMKFTEYGSDIIQKAEIAQIARRLQERATRKTWVSARRKSQIRHVDKTVTEILDTQQALLTFQEMLTQDEENESLPGDEMVHIKSAKKFASCFQKNPKARCLSCGGIGCSVCGNANDFGDDSEILGKEEGEEDEEDERESEMQAERTSEVVEAAVVCDSNACVASSPPVPSGGNGLLPASNTGMEGKTVFRDRRKGAAASAGPPSSPLQCALEKGGAMAMQAIRQQSTDTASSHSSSTGVWSTPQAPREEHVQIHDARPWYPSQSRTAAAAAKLQMPALTLPRVQPEMPNGTPAAALGKNTASHSALKASGNTRPATTPSTLMRSSMDQVVPHP